MKYEPILATIGEAAEILRVSEPTIYRLMRAKRLQSVKLGCRTLFRIKTLHEFADSLPHSHAEPPTRVAL